jgi:hypothetical protein
MSRIQLSFALAAVAVLTVTPVLLYHGARTQTSERTLIIITPNSEQMRQEFSTGFMRWHKKKYGEQVGVVWNTPGGATEIRRMLVAQYEAALRANQPVGGDADIVFGGGSYEYQSMSRPISIGSGDTFRETTILQPCDWMTPEKLKEIYGPNEIDGHPLYDEQLHWFGVALSTFGILSNTQQFTAHGIEIPKVWADLADPRLFQTIALVNPSQSGSVATAFETILQRLGWKRGWQIMRRAAANTNQIVAAGSTIPTTVGNGESWTGIAIDFYGRYQAQSLADSATQTGISAIDRLQFCTPKGQSVVDADPVAILRGAPNADLAQHFVEFCLSIDAQMLWQLPSGEGEMCGYSRPENYSLRRMPILRAAYECCEKCFVDQINPFDDQSVLVSDPNFRDFVSPLFVPMAITSTDSLRLAWHAIFTHPAYPHGKEIVSAEDVSDPILKSWIEAFDALPTIEGPHGVTFDLNDPQSLSAVRTGWIKGGFAQSGLWEEREKSPTIMRRKFNAFFANQYRKIIDSAQSLSASRGM